MDIKYYANTKRDVSKISKLNKLNNKETFWDEVGKLTKNITSCRGVREWQILAEIRHNELLTGYENIYTEVRENKPTRYFKRLDNTEVFIPN